MSHLDLNKFSIGNICIGADSNLADGNYSCKSISYHVKNRAIVSISVRLSEFYSNGDVFVGNVTLKNNRLFLNEHIQPQQVTSFFHQPVEHWDDGVELNYQFQIDGVTIEFSWHHSSNGLIANYVHLEKEC